MKDLVAVAQDLELVRIEDLPRERFHDAHHQALASMVVGRRRRGPPQDLPDGSRVAHHVCDERPSMSRRAFTLTTKFSCSFSAMGTLSARTKHLVAITRGLATAPDGLLDLLDVLREANVFMCASTFLGAGKRAAV